MKKKLNVASVTNELEQGSVFFQPRPVPPAVEAPASEDEAKPRNLGNQEPRKQVSQETRKPGNQEIAPLKREALEEFDLRREPTRKDTFVYAVEESDAVEDLKTEIRRKFDVKATKNDIARCALYALLQDYRARGEDSIVLQHLKRKRKNS